MAKGKIEENVEENQDLETKSEKKEQKRYVYIGPILMKGKYIEGKIFKEIPGELDKYLEEKPALKQLFVDVEHLAETKVELLSDETAIKAIYRDVTNWAREGGK